MSRVCLLLLVGALAVTATKFSDEEVSPKLTETVFRPGVEYTYKYTSQVLTGIPNGGNQYSGLKLKCTVRMHIKSGSLVVVKLEDIKMCEVNTDLRTSLPSEILPEEFCTSTTSDHIRVMITELLKPFSFRYDNGLVSRLETDSSDPFWSVNIKRGILNLLHMSLSQEREVTDVRPDVFDTADYSLRNVIMKDRSFDKLFKVKEQDVVGDCETLYAIYEKEPSVNYVSDSFHVTKVKDYKRCTNKVIYEQGLFAGHTSWLWLPHDEHKSLVTPVTHVDYELTGNRNNFLIRKAKLHSEYIFTPYSEEGGSMVTYIKSLLELIGTESSRSPITVGPTPTVHNHALLLHVPHALAKASKNFFSSDVSSYPERSSVWDNMESTPFKDREAKSTWWESAPSKWELETPITDELKNVWDSEVPRRSDKWFGYPEEEGEESSWDETLFNKWESTYKKFDWTRDFSAITPTSNLDKVRMMLKEILSSMTPYISEETPSKLIHLKRVLETCSSDELWTIVKDVCSMLDYSEPEYKRAREIILDILPVLPKPIVPHIIRSLVSKNIIFPKRGAYMIALHSLMAPGTPRIVKSMLTVCKDPIMRSDEQLKRTCVLGLGTVTHKLFGMHLKSKIPKAMSFGVIDEVVRELKTLLTTTTNHETKMLALKAIGNTGLPEFIPELHRIIREKTHTPIIRKLAVYALRRMTILAPHEVNKVVMPVFMNPRETSEMRIASFLMTMYTKPSTTTVLLMVNRLRTDPSFNLKSFVYSYLSSLSRASLPAHRHAAKSAKMAMLAMKPYDFGFSFSKGFHFDFKSEKFDMGAMLESFLIHTPTSSFPKGFVAKLGAVFAHHPLYLFETGMEMKGVDDIVSSIYHKTRPLWSKLSSFDWSRVFSPEWYKEVYPEVSDWISSGKFDLRDWLKSFEKPSTPFEKTSWGSVDSTISDILSKIKFEDRTFEMPELLTYFKILSNQVTFFNIDNTLVSDILSNTEWLSSFITNYKGEGSTIPVHIMKTLPLIDNCFIIPTPIGMPLHLNFSALAVTKVHGHITPVSLPSIRDLWNSRSLPEDIKVAVDIKPSFAIKMLCEMGVHVNILKATTAIKSHVIGHAPIKSEISMNWREKKFKFHWEVPQESFTPLKVGMKVVTRIFKMPLRHFELVTPSHIFDKEVLHPAVVKPLPIQISPITTVFGMHVDVANEVHTRRATWAPFYPLCGRFNLHFTCRPTEDRPRLAEFKVIFGSSYPSEYTRSPIERSESSSYDEWDVLSQIFPARKDYRTSLRDEFETEISSVTPFSEITNPRSRHVTFILRTVGGTRPRYVQSHLTWIHSHNYLAHQFNYQVTGSPIFGLYSSPIKAMLNGMIDLKTVIKPYLSSDNLMAKLDFYYGDRSNSDSDFSLKVLSGRTGMSWESDYSPLTRYSWFTNLPAEKYEYYCVVNYNRLSPIVEDKLVQGYEFLKVLFYPYLYVKKTGLTSEMNKVTAYLKFIPTHKKLSMIINTPTELDLIIDVPTFHPLFSRETNSLAVPSPVLMTEGFLPTSAFAPEEFESTKTPRWSWFKSWTGQCTVTDNVMKTFDDVTYTLPEMPAMCETILARDCSPVGKWVVTVTPISTVPSMSDIVKMIRVLVPHYEFKLTPSSKSYGPMKLFVNGLPKEITSSLSLSLPETTMSDELAYSVSKEGDMIKIECMKMGIVIMTNGKYIMIQSTSMNRGRMCGLCGNFDDRSFSEFEGPTKTIYERPEHFVVKYTVPTSECNVEDLVTKYKVPDYTFSGECMHEMRNIPKVTFRRGEKHVCFTLKPEPVCSKDCKRINPRTKYTGFHCLPANDISTETLLRESRTRVLDELAWKRVDMYDYIDTQDKCVSM